MHSETTDPHKGKQSCGQILAAYTYSRALCQIALCLVGTSESVDSEPHKMRGSTANWKSFCNAGLIDSENSLSQTIRSTYIPCVVHMSI